MNFTSYENKKTIDKSVQKQTDIHEFYLNKIHTLQKAKKNPAGNIQKMKGIYDYQDYNNISNQNGLKDRWFPLDYGMLRQIADKVIVISSIIQTRCSQGRPFGRISNDRDKVGYTTRLKDLDKHPTKKQQENIKEINKFFKKTGLTDIPIIEGELDREDYFDDFLEKVIRDALIINQIAVVLRYNVGGDLIEFRVIDGATIKKVDPKTGYRGDKSIVYVQEIDGNVNEENGLFRRGELIFDTMNKTSDLKYAFYGKSTLEMAISTITGFLNSVAYNNEFFNSSAQPKGFVAFKDANLDEEQLEELRRQWTMMFSGIKGLWKTPFLQGNAEWKNLAPSNRDMEFNQWLQVLQSWLCALFKIDQAELGLKANLSQGVMFENNESKLDYSKDRGLKDILSFIEKFCNKILSYTKWGEEYEIVFTGIEQTDRKGEAELDKMHVETFKTLDEIRAEHDYEPLPNGEGEIVLNPIYMQNKASQGAGDVSEGQIEEGEEFSDEDFEDVFKSKKYIEMEVEI